MPSNRDKLQSLRRVITENLRVQRGGSESIPYVDIANVLSDITARQNHAIFGRRGCGKTLLIHFSARKLDGSIRCIYLNCEDFKRHSFPNVLIEILDALFAELQSNLSGWFGRKKKSKQLIEKIRIKLAELSSSADIQERKIREQSSSDSSRSDAAGAGISHEFVSIRADASATSSYRNEIEISYSRHDDKLRELDMWLPELKRHVSEFFELSTNVSAIFLQIDDFYHLNRVDQPFVMDYIHRLCKDLPVYFKVATLRHASILYADRHGQPIGAQERHDYQPINVDFTLANLKKTQAQNKAILREFGKLAGMTKSEIDGLFKGEGFERLILAGGGVPRDCLSLFLEALDAAAAASGSDCPRIGKDDVRILSRSNFERRIEELKQDSEGREQDALIRGIYVLRKFCIEKKYNVFLVSEQMMQQQDRIRDLVHRLLDYRIVHNCGGALTHKSQAGTYQAFAIDIGCYAHMRKLDGRFVELDLSRTDAKEKMRSTPILSASEFDSLWKNAPEDPERTLLEEEAA